MSLTLRRSLGLLAATAVLVSACGASTTPSPSAAPATEAPPVESPSAEPSMPAEGPALFDTAYASQRVDGVRGGTLIIGDWQEANLWNPFYQGQVIEATVSAALWRGLVTTTFDFKYAGDLAQDPLPTIQNGGVVIPGDNGEGMKVTFKLRDGLVWSDGTPLTCADFEATWKWVMDPANTGLYAGTTGWDVITAFDCSTEGSVVINFKQQYFDYLVLYSTQTPVLQKAYIESIPIADQVNGKGWAATDMPNVPVSGPFKVESVTPGQELRVVRNDNYVNPITGETAYLDSIVWKWYGDADAMIAGFRAGETDYASDLADADLPKVLDLGDIVQALPALQYEFFRPQWGPITPSGKPGPMSDLVMREALQYAVDKDGINARLMGGLATIAYTNTSPNAWYYDPTVEQRKFDLEKAKQILDAGGWAVGADGVREKAGQKAEINLCTTTRQLRQDTLALVAADLAKIGIKATVQAVSAADIFATYNEGTDETPCNLSRHVGWDVALHTFSVALSPYANYPVYHSSQVAPNGQNDAQVNDPDLDRILTDLKTTADFTKGLALMQEFQKIYVEQAVEVPLYFRKDVNLVQPYVKNWFGNPTSVGHTWNCADWFIQK
jgi:peptide/nickel transport system substrate-binding protein